jgi:hypothetical protein
MASYREQRNYDNDEGDTIVILFLQEEAFRLYIGFHVGIVQDNNSDFFSPPIGLFLRRRVLNLRVFPSANCTGDCSMYYVAILLQYTELILLFT